MPIVSATVVQPETYVRLETSWADTPIAEYVRFVRINVSTCEETYVRVHTAYDTTGQYILLSCDDTAVVWDTEAPHNESLSYRVESLETTVTASTGPYIIDDNDLLYLKDPVRPCHDRSIALCIADPDCDEDGPGIMFAKLLQEDYAPHQINVLPVNSSFPIAMSRRRQAVVSGVLLATQTFDDRDDLLQLTEPGSPLLFQGLQVYGMPDRYLSIDVHGVGQISVDQRMSVRVHSLPFVAVQRPPGPSQGVCGTRWVDMCDLYATWGDLATAGLTWNDLLLGYASGQAGVARRRWIDVETDFADWAAVEANGTWAELRDDL